MAKERVGFSTGALERGDYRSALGWMREHNVQSVELSALRYDELEPLVNDLSKLQIDGFTYVSFHAPSSFPKEREEHVVSLLGRVFNRGWNIIVHPDMIYTPKYWQHFGAQLLIENMDRRKATGRTVKELGSLLHKLPKAKLCLDMAHARQLDTTLTLLWQIIKAFRKRIAEVHISELDSRCRHLPLSTQAVWDYRQFAARLRGVPAIIESMLDQRHSSLRHEEVRLARLAMTENDDPAQESRMDPSQTATFSFTGKGAGKNGTVFYGKRLAGNHRNGYVTMKSNG